ncbi:class I adenylate-forming enzyme family protein [Sphingomonas bacterium]|uniref:class I adenylate-forming enzyme family protein n=1 Tax=Sphingomonas bacterium TaxID=1895847 RepID=UPI001576433B|nr:class I adenylate-forming enzyme family protein [Sphingomonas bacterium]
MTDGVMDYYATATGRLTAPEGPFAVREAVVQGRAMRVYAAADVNIVDTLSRSEQRFHDRTLACEDGRYWTYAELLGASRRLAGALRDRHAIVPGDRVGLAMRNRPEWFVAFAAIVRAGGVAVLFNSRGAGDELAAAAADVPCRLILADDERAERIVAAGVATPTLALAEIMAAAQDGPALDDQRVDADAPAVVLFTSGTTGRPKGAVLTQRNIANMTVNLQFLSAIGLEMAAHSYGIPVETLRTMAPRPSSLLVFPMFHISGLTVFFMMIESGGLLTTMRRWNAAAALPQISGNTVTMISGPPMVLNDLLDAPGAETHLAGVGSIGVGGQATPSSLTARIARAMPRAMQTSGWGMTEASGNVAAIVGAVASIKPESCGKPSPVVDLRVVGEDGVDVTPGEAGELWLGGALVMAGYCNAAAATDATLVDGWLRTGDVGRVDGDGFIHLVDRKKDMVISGGENIYSAEVERVLGAEGDFVEVALFGIADARLGERAVAAVTLRDGARWTEDAVKALARASLANYKVPTAVCFDLGPFPRNVTGKVDKAQLRARFLAQVVETV